MNSQTDTYFVEIERTFNHHRGSHRLLSPLDWSLMQSWHERGIPLHVILNTIATVFDRKQPRDRALINSLSFIKKEVENAFEIWNENRIGAEDTGNDEILDETEEFRQLLNGLSREFKKCSDRLKAKKHPSFHEAAQVCFNISRDLSKLAGENQICFEPIEKTLCEWQSPLLKVLSDCLLSSELQQMKKEIEGNLQPFRGELFAVNYNANANKLLTDRLCQRLDVPRLTLFQ